MSLYNIKMKLLCCIVLRRTYCIDHFCSLSQGCGDGSAGALVTLQFELASTDNDVTPANRDTAYAIVDSEPPNAPFRIERYSGQLYVTSVGVDFENVQQWTLTLAVFDEANHLCPVSFVCCLFVCCVICLQWNV